MVVVGVLSSTACDPWPNECDDGDNVCDGNVANVCVQPGDVHARTERTDCGSQKCVVARKDDFKLPMCTARDVPACPTVGATDCRQGRAFECWELVGGGRTWVSVNQSC